MKIMVLTLSVYGPDPSYDAAMHRLRFFTASAKKHGVPKPHVYGIGRIFPGYRVISMDWQRDYLRENRADYTHIFFHHGWDAMFCGPWEEILDKYRKLGSPPSLYASHFGLGNVSVPEVSYPNIFASRNCIYKYPQVGGHFSEIGYIIDAFDKMLDQTRTRQTGDDCFQLYDAIEQGWFQPSIDTNCDIFQVETINTEIINEIDTISGATLPSVRVYNTITCSKPCIIHVAGGYNDPVHAKDPQMSSLARQLQIAV